MKLLLMVLAMGLVALQSVTATFIDPDQVVLRTGDTLPLTRALFMSDVGEFHSCLFFHLSHRLTSMHFPSSLSKEASEGNKREAAERFWTEKAMPMYGESRTISFGSA